MNTLPLCTFYYIRRLSFVSFSTSSWFAAGICCLGLFEALYLPFVVWVEEPVLSWIFFKEASRCPLHDIYVRFSLLNSSCSQVVRDVDALKSAC